MKLICGLDNFACEALHYMFQMTIDAAGTNLNVVLAIV